MAQVSQSSGADVPCFRLASLATTLAQLHRVPSWLLLPIDYIPPSTELEQAPDKTLTRCYSAKTPWYLLLIGAGAIMVYAPALQKRRTLSSNCRPLPSDEGRRRELKWHPDGATHTGTFACTYTYNWHLPHHARARSSGSTPAVSAKTTS